ncbi:hypothetical protein LY90DRAFT_698865 [Neocallimastix californiae]|uniref:Uncharacterized protein n=1 Tax=Neocallimastix californiae TaxID=1754190 RepID=A0A1Y2EX77_9FUNG|nr:hypothetical protein LY90DRAFT_698865 [Neocallimastix californiae]|eukprot:ORY76189.1 hypothetical protein LY90DRAFT_698865 [Neocallimastix californiae]
MDLKLQKQKQIKQSNSNDNDWETCYSDEEDYIETMGNLKIESSGVKMKEGKSFKKLEEQHNSTNQQSVLDKFNDDFIDENSIANYSFDGSMISEMTDLSFITNGQNLEALLHSNNINTLQDEIENAIDREASINPDTSLIAKAFFNSNEESDLSTVLPPSVKGNNSFMSTVPTETGTTISSDKTVVLEPNTNTNNNALQPNDSESFNPMFINRISSFPIVRQSVQAIKSTSIGNLADRTLRRVASTRLPVINVPKLPSLPIVGKKNEDKNEKSGLTRSNSISLEDATKNLPGLATMDSIGCKTLDKLEENFPMINDPDLLEKILNRLEELREIGENTYVVQSSLNSLQNMHNRLNHIVFSIATTKTVAANTTYHDENFTASSKIQSSTTTTARASVETINGGCCCCCKCHEQHINNNNNNNSTNIHKIVQQQQENLIKSTYQNLNDEQQQPKEQQQQQQSKANFFVRYSQRPGIFKEIVNIRTNLQNNINSIPNVMYGRINNVLTAIEKKLLSGTELEKEMLAKANPQENNNNNNNNSKDKGKMVTTTNVTDNDITKKITSEPSQITNTSHHGSLQTTITTTMTTSTSTTSTVTTTINSNVNSNNDPKLSSPLPPYHHYRMASSSDYETDSTLYSPSLSVYSPRTMASSPLSLASTPTIHEAKTSLEIKDQNISTQAQQDNINMNMNMNMNNNNGGSNVHDLYSFLEEVNKLLSIYLITRKKTNQDAATN